MSYTIDDAEKFLSGKRKLPRLRKPKKISKKQQIRNILSSQSLNIALDSCGDFDILSAFVQIQQIIDDK